MIEIIKNHISHIIIASATILSAVLAAYFTLKGQLKRDEKSRLYEQRKVVYQEAINLFMDIFKNFFEKSPLEKTDEDFFKALKFIVIYGSPKIMNKINEIGKMTELEKNTLQVLYLVEELIFEMRREINPKVKYKREEILSLIPKWKEFKADVNKTK